MLGAVQAALLAQKSSGSGYVTQGRYFDGTNDFATKASDLCADGKLLSFSVWLRRDSTVSATFNIFATHAATTSAGVSLNYNPSSGVCRITARTAAAAFGVNATLTISADNNWHNVRGSFDTANASNRSFVYDNSQGTPTWANYTSGDIDFTTGIVAIGSRSDGSQKFLGDISELWVTNSFLDMVTNESKFYAGGKPVSLGADGSTPTGSQPLIYLPYGDPADNKGSLGNFTVTGSLDVSTTSPSD